MKITFLQSADPCRYYDMLQETSATVRRYCLANGFDYEQYVGIKRGHMLWQAAFNRIYLLKEMLDRGTEGWVFYLDADAFIVDMHFDLVNYLIDKQRYGAIFAGHISEVYDINTGGFAVNLSHPAGKALVLEYHRQCERAADAAYHKAISWEHDVINDQYMLYLILKEWYETYGFHDVFLFERTNHSFVNNGPFIRQHLRTSYSSFESRIEAIRSSVNAVMADWPPTHPDRGAGIYLTAGHPRLLTECGNKTDVGIFTTGREGVFLRGPHVNLEAGQYIVRLFGRAASELPPVELRAGGIELTPVVPTLPTGSPDVLVELSVKLVAPVEGFEMVMSASSSQHLCVHAVQIVTLTDS